LVIRWQEESIRTEATETKVTWHHQNQTIANPGYTITPEKQDMNLKSLLMMMMEDFKKEIQENMGKHLETLKEETKIP
jgi:predicted metal-dependent hydrolase